MLQENARRSLSYFSIDFAPRVDFARRLVDLVLDVERKLDHASWVATAEQYIFRCFHDQFFYIFESKRIYCQCLGLGGWVDHFDRHLSIIEAGLKAMGVARINRLGFQVHSWFDLSMSHGEICDLMYGSFLPSSSELEPIFGRPEDLLLQVHGSFKELKTKTIIAPQTPAQAAESFMRTTNLDGFVENRLLDTRIREFRERVATDNLLLDMDVHREDVPAEVLASFARDSLREANRISEAVILRLKSLRSKRESTRGTHKP